MKKLINILAFLLALAIVTIVFLPEKAIDREAPVYVEHEWDTLENVIVGTPKMLKIPQIHRSILGYGYIINNEKIMKTSAGKPIASVDPNLAKRLDTYTSTIYKDLKEKNVNIVLFNPEVLEKEEINYLTQIQKGSIFLFPKDAIVVIGNTVIECAQRVPMRAKERFIVRKIFQPYIKDNPTIRYIPAPVPSPSFSDKALYLEGSDILVDGRNVYVGCSGRATTPLGAKWLQSVLGPQYKVYKIDISGFVHLNNVLAFIRPELGLKVSGAITSDLPKPLKNWEFIEISQKDAQKYETSILVVGPNKVFVDERFETLILALRAKNVDVSTYTFDDIANFGSGMGSFYSPIRRAYDKDINSEKLNKEYFIKHSNELLEDIKTYDYAEFFANLQSLLVEKSTQISEKVSNLVTTLTNK